MQQDASASQKRRPSRLARLLAVAAALAVTAYSIAVITRDWFGVRSLFGFDGVLLAAVFVGIVSANRNGRALFTAVGVGFGVTFALHWQTRAMRWPDAGTFEHISWPDLVVQAIMLAGLLLILLGMDRVAAGAVRWLVNRTNRLAGRFPGRAVVAAARLLLLWLVAIPWLFVFLQTHRPKFDYPDRPAGEYREVRPLIWHQPPAQPSNVFVILCHGIGADRSDLDMHRQMFHELGCHVISFDLPGHGRSGSMSTTFGVRESEAILDVVQRIGGKGWNEARPDVVIGFGASMGGTSLLLAAQRRPDLFNALIIDSAYTRLEDMAEHQLQLLPSVLRWPMRTTGRLLLAAQIGRPIERVDAVASMSKIDDIPKLFIHGTDDQIVPAEHGRELFAAAGGQKRLLELPGSGHLHGIITDWQEYRQAAKELIESARR